MLKIVILSTLFLLRTFNAAESSKNIVDDKKTNATISIIAGILNGVTNVENLDELKECLQNNTEVTELLEEIKEDISSKNINGMFEGMRLIGKLIVQLPSQLA